MDTKQLLKKALNTFPDSADEGVEYIEDVLRRYADHIEATEPYATRAIDALRYAANSATDILEIVDGTDE